MTNNSRKRLIWEEIMRDPDIYRVCEAGSSSNSYVFFSGEDFVVIDPSSVDMIGSICRLAHITEMDSGRIALQDNFRGGRRTGQENAGQAGSGRGCV